MFLHGSQRHGAGFLRVPQPVLHCCSGPVARTAIPQMISSVGMAGAAPALASTAPSPRPRLPLWFPSTSWTLPSGLFLRRVSRTRSRCPTATTRPSTRSWPADPRGVTGRRPLPGGHGHQGRTAERRRKDRSIFPTTDLPSLAHHSSGQKLIDRH